LPLDPAIVQSAGLVALLGFSAFFSMSETALISADRVRLRGLAREGDLRARRLEHLLERPERVLTTILIGNNLVNIAATALATLIAIQVFGSAGAAIATGIMTFVVLIFAEITPKTLAVRRSLSLALRVSGPLVAIHALLLPFVWFFGHVARGLLRPFGITWQEKAPFVTQSMIAQLVRMGVEEGEVEKFEERVISEVFDFTETPLHKVMTPRERVRYMAKEAKLQEALEMAGRTGHSRLPVADGDFDHVLGFVHAKDLLRFSDEQLHEVPVTQVLRAVLLARDDARSDRVLARMQRERKLMAIVQDSEGHNLGIATVEDLLEELVGEIHDEFDRTEGPAGVNAPSGAP